MTKEEYEKLPEKQKKVFKIIFSGGYHTARNIRASLGDEDMNVSNLVQSLNEKDKNVCFRWRYQKGRGYYKIYYYKNPGEWE